MKLPAIGKKSNSFPMAFYLGAGFIAAIIIGLALFSWLAPGKPAPRGSQGILDLSHWNFSQDGDVMLVGEWQFIPDHLVKEDAFLKFDPAAIILRKVPDTRYTYPKTGKPKFGSGTYHLSILLPPESSQLGLRYSTIWTAFEIDEDSATIAQGGKPSLNPAEAVSGLSAGVVRLSDNGNGRIDLTVRVSNQDYRWGGITRPLIIGKAARLEAEKHRDDMLTFMTIGAILGLALNSLFIFSFRIRDRVYLYFAGFAFLVAIRAATSGDGLLATILPGIDFNNFVRTEYGATFLIIPFVASFFYRLFPDDMRPVELACIALPSFAFWPLAFFAPLRLLTQSVIPFTALALVTAIYGFFVAALRPAIRKRPGAGISLVAGILLFLSVLFNVRVQILLAEAESAIPLGLTVFVIIQSLALAKRFTWAFESSETLSVDLASANAMLEKEITYTEKARHELETALTEKDLLLKEVHHRVKNSLQIVVSLINLQEHRASDPAIIEAYRSIGSRIRAISAVHERLYGIDSERRIDFRAYASDLIEQYRQSYADSRAEISLSCGRIDVPMDLCIELGLIMTELVINALRHGIAPRQGGKIGIEVRREGDRLILNVSDTGPGFPPGFDPMHAATIGFKTLISLLQRRDGELMISSQNGSLVQVSLLFPAEASLPASA